MLLALLIESVKTAGFLRRVGESYCMMASSTKNLDPAFQGVGQKVYPHTKFYSMPLPFFPLVANFFL